ncbi:FliO/MopB family protein [Tundrisphaera sp. TA3]|uniref:FliO/MopB family protein n=1 Tax=Tundrisphaera sp. TA3 TaxID=3435775 RepID=UPI003EBE7CE3
MLRTHTGRPSLAALASLAALLALGANEPPPTAAIRPPSLDGRIPAPMRPDLSDGASAPPSGGSGGWWIGTAGIGAALAVFGGLAAASRRYLPAREASGSLRVVGRVSLSAKQAVYLVRAGDRILILGGGSQGPPTLLGEMDEPAEPIRTGPSPSRHVEPIRVPSPTARGFDQRIGDDE